MRGKLGDRVKATSAGQSFMESDEYKQLKQVRREVNEFKSDVRDQVDASQNPVVQRTSQAVDLVFQESGCARAVKEMKKYDADFDIEELTYEAEEIFQEFFCNYLAGNAKYMDKVCGGPALGTTKAMIQIMEKEGWQYKYEELLNCGNAIFQGGQIADRMPQFTYHIEVQEFDEKVRREDGEPYIPVDGEGKPVVGGPSIMQNTYRIALARHSEPDIELTGHYWEIVEFYKIGEVKQLV